jgi:UDP-N-acetylmuramyl pentapeptide phosphotransferase/UDP-N-acetylglucosamine-1-phosphate transferase
MLNVFLTASAAFIITFFAIPAIMRVAVEKKLFDLPDARKLHTKPIASLGGIAIFVGLFIATLISISGKDVPEFQYFMASSLLIFFLGLKDDILILSPTKKFLGQLAAAAILIHLGGIRIDGLYGFMGIEQIPAMIGIVLSYATIIVVINAFNLIDGVDGLAGILGVLTTAVFGSYFLAAGLTAYALLSFSMTACLVAFLYYNYHPAKIFMGDSGSLLLGLINAVLVIKFINVAGSSAGVFPVQSAAAIGFAVLAIPLLDTLRVFGIRISRKRSPFAPDRLHIHHLLLDRGLNHSQVTLSCLGLNLSFIAMAYFGRTMGTTMLISLMIFTMYTLVGALVYFKKPVRKMMVAKSFYTAKETMVPSTTKVVSIKPEAAAVEQ